MKPFYCKPASYEEAVEICERAIANGADKFEWPCLEKNTICREYRINTFPFWGVVNKKTYCGVSTAVFSSSAELLPIEQVRERFPHPEYDAVESKFVPEVGGEAFEWSKNGRDFEEGRLLFNDGISMLIAHNKYPRNRWHQKSNDPNLIFRPLKTEAEIRREKAISKLTEALGALAAGRGDDGFTLKELATDLVDLGYFKPKVLTDELIERSFLGNEGAELAAKWARDYVLGATDE